MSHLQGYFISLRFRCMTIHCSTVLSSMAKPFKELIFHNTLFCSTNAHVFQNITPLQSLLFNRIPFFLNMLTGRKMEFHMPGLFHFSHT
jgi:hypothetical protein